MNTIEQCKKLDVIFDISENSWHVQGNSPTIISKLDYKLKKQSMQVKSACGRNSKGKTPFWFRRLEELLIDDAENRKVKEDLCSGDVNTSVLQPRGGHGEQVDKYMLSRCKGCNLNRKGKEKGCLINCSRKLIRGVATGISKKENRWITNFPTTLLKDNSKSFLTPIQECPLLQLEEIDSEKRELVKAKAQAVSLAWASLKDETRAVITLRDLCTIVFKETRQEWIAARQDYVRGLVKQKTMNSLRALLTSSKETHEALRALLHMYQEGFYRVIWLERCKKQNDSQEPVRKRRKVHDRDDPQESGIWEVLTEKFTNKQVFSSLPST
ncbi:4008_t:CDS:2, partial [Gigaspora rosea]